MIVSNLHTMLLMKVVFSFSIYFFTKMLILAFCSFLPIKSHQISICTFPLSHFIPQATRGPSLEASLCAILEIAPCLKPLVKCEKFWKCLRRHSYPLGFLLPLFREVKYSNRTKGLPLKRKSCNSRMAVFKSTFNCSHAKWCEGHFVIVYSKSVNT